MNYKLLKELMKQSETECGFNPEKFAELIVKECADVAARAQDENMNWDISGIIKERFGVQ